jgi:hypothetical protein
MDEYAVIDYDGNANRIKESYFLASGKPGKYTDLEYENSLLVSERYYSNRKQLLKGTDYEYDSEGRKKRIIHLDRNEKIKEILEREYMQK